MAIKDKHCKEAISRLGNAISDGKITYHQVKMKIADIVIKNMEDK